MFFYVFITRYKLISLYKLNARTYVKWVLQGNALNGILTRI